MRFKVEQKDNIFIPQVDVNNDDNWEMITHEQKERNDPTWYRFNKDEANNDVQDYKDRIIESLILKDL